MHTTAQAALHLHAGRTESCHVTALSDKLNAAKGDVSIDRLIAAAEKRSGREIPATARAGIYKALNGQHAKNPREDTLRLWAEVFELDVRDLREAAKKPRGELGPWQPVAESARLDQDQRTALDLLIKAIVRGGAEDAYGPAANTDGDPDAGGGEAIKFEPPNRDPFGDDLDALPDERDEQPPITGRSTGKAARRGDDEPS